jgi:cystathionine gamma-lyase
MLLVLFLVLLTVSLLTEVLEKYPYYKFLMIGLKTLHVRMRKHEENALALAKFLSSSPKVVEVIYPGLPSHRQHELAKRQQKGFG